MIPWLNYIRLLEKSFTFQHSGKRFHLMLHLLNCTVRIKAYGINSPFGNTSMKSRQLCRKIQKVFYLQLNKPSFSIIFLESCINSSNVRETKFCHFQFHYQVLKHPVESCVFASTLVKLYPLLQMRLILYLHILGEFAVLSHR